jgi:hypothetical protein
VLKKPQGTVSPDNKASHVGDVEKPGPLARGQVFLHNAGWIKDRHLPPGKINYLGFMFHVPFI